MGKLTLEYIKRAVEGEGAAFRVLTELEPAGGSHDKLFPPTYQGGKYLVETRRADGREVRCVLLDSVQSQANRLEEALLEARAAGKIQFPDIEVDFPGAGLSQFPRFSVLRLPHRVYDAYVRDSRLNGTIFRNSPEGKRLVNSSPTSATALLELCPPVLLFGAWDSTGFGTGGLGAKFARVICSEIVGFSAEVGNRAANRIDPFGIEKASAVIYEADTDLGWTIDESKARKEGSKAKKFQRGAAGEAGRPSIINYGNIITDIQPGGATMDRALQTTVVSLAGLRKLFFPDQDGKQGQERDTAARAYLATLALAAILWQQERYGYDLRSRCVLRPKKRTMALVPNAPGRDDEPLELTLEEALELYQEASAALKAARFDWDPTRTLTLKPDDQVVEMVKLNLQMRGRGEAE